MSEYETLTDDLIRKLNKACDSFCQSGKCKNDYECFAIGWCNDVWSACGIGCNTAQTEGKNADTVTDTTTDKKRED